MKPTTLLTTATLLLTASALPYASEPAAQPAQQQQTKRDADSASVAILQKIAPTSNTCDNAPAAGECATAAQAAMPIIDSFLQYSISTPPEQAALLSWMAFESGDFKYVRNHFPGTPGQGCRNMMSPDYVRSYASVVPGADATNGNPAKLLDSVISVGGEWAAAAWFHSTQCSDVVKDGLKNGGKAGWQAWITGCVKTTLTDARTQYWERAAQALGMPTN